MSKLKAIAKEGPKVVGRGVVYSALSLWAKFKQISLSPAQRKIEIH